MSHFTQDATLWFWPEHKASRCAQRRILKRNGNPIGTAEYGRVRPKPHAKTEPVRSLVWGREANLSRLPDWVFLT